ncbi:hypothetical protein AC482_01265 [miscellaneous Crenarchaeota group-15 archaeon DG-45]|uniref:Uncharacterized protein n=1 Tax=miscellaneous Crenarchaeota group-15 archaeon DG-45 TaxID=1685127 RepID=A0A0M0BSB6_9ARCH|nr:MAG: hypothetical protein AC482_01265 [miscellaneous Crenarchaeota group-15 archaeon DG-45]
MELWGHPWWILGLYSLAALFMLLSALFLASYRALRRGSLPRSAGAALSSNPMESTALGYTALEGVALRSSAGASGSRLGPWVTRIFIAIVLQCAAIYLISTYPGMGSPFWLGVALHGFTYGSAAVYYVSWGEEP